MVLNYREFDVRKPQKNCWSEIFSLILHLIIKRLNNKKFTPMTDVNLVEIFCILDEFCKYFTPELKKHQLSSPEKRCRNRKCRLSDSEVMTILVIFHTKHFRDLKSFYKGYVCKHMRKEFSKTLCRQRMHQSEPF